MSETQKARPGMGLFSARKQRRQAREHRVREAAYDKAIAKGESPEHATMAAERAVRRRRRIRRAALITGSS